jgi:3-oxoacyl-[acyl-carrier-protein] synthase I
MKKPVYILSDAVITPLGRNSDETLHQLYAGATSVIPYSNTEFGTYYTSRFAEESPYGYNHQPTVFTRIEQLIIDSVQQALEPLRIQADQQDVLFVITSTKGNIDQLNNPDFDQDRLRIGEMAAYITRFFNNPNQPVVISNACISGVQAIEYACYALQQGTYKYIVVTGADLASDFVLSGFYSFQAMSPFPCKPFDKDRAGVSIGEGCGTLVLSTVAEEGSIEIAAVASSNDANHLSGPSRTGDGLSNAIVWAMQEAQVQASEIDIISAHGTATMYNDEMESLAFQTAQVTDALVYSIKGNIGHTLGAAGIIETAFLARCLKNNSGIPSLGFEHQGTSVTLNICTELNTNKELKIGLKTASGFGGGNAALILKK